MRSLPSRPRAGTGRPIRRLDPVSAKEKKSSHAGHRQRLRERFLKGGASALADYELLELVLYLAHPRANSARAIASRGPSRFLTNPQSRAGWTPS